MEIEIDTKPGGASKSPEKKKPVCARCKNPDKSTRKHHWPLASSRVVPLCNHCYSVARRERKRSKKFNGR